MAITWRSLMGQTADPVRAMAAAQDSFNGMFGTLNKALETRNNSMAEASKQGFLNELYGAQSVEDFDQSRDTLAGKLQGLSAENQAVVRPLLEQRRAQLMQSTLAGQQYADAQQTRGQQDVVSGLQEALMRASTPEEAQRLEQAIGIYQSNGMLDSQGGAALMKDALARGTELDNQAWTNKEREQKELDWDHLAKKRPYELDQVKANAKKAQGEANGTAGLSLSDIKNMMGIVSTTKDAEMANDTEVVKNSQLGGGLAVEAAGRKAITKRLEETGVSAWDLMQDKNTFLDAVVKEGSGRTNPILSADGREVLIKNKEDQVIRLPFTQSLMETLITQDNGNFTDPGVNSVVNRLESLTKQPYMLEEIKKFTEAKERIYETKEEKAAALKELTRSLFGEEPAEQKDEQKKK